MLRYGGDQERLMDRYDRISSEMKRVISDIIRNDVKDPRIPLMTSILDVKVTKDLKYAKVYFSILGTEADKKQAEIALSSSSGFIRKKIGENMIIRAVPELKFIRDESIERGAYMSELIDKLAKEGGMGEREEDGQNR